MTERDRLDELGRELPWDRPDDVRREAVRASLLAAADSQLPAARRRWAFGGVAFAAGVAAAAIAAIVVWPHGGAPTAANELVAVEASPTAQLEHTTTRTPTGNDEVVRVHAGRARVVVGEARQGDRVRVATGDAEIDGAATYELAVAGDRLTEVAVHTGTAIVRVTGQQPVFLAAGQSWHAAVITADLSPSTPTSVDTTTSPTTLPTHVDTTLPTQVDTTSHDGTATLPSRIDTTTSPAHVDTTSPTHTGSPTLPTHVDTTTSPTHVDTTTSPTHVDTTTTPHTGSTTTPHTGSTPTPAADPAITTNLPPIVAPGARAQTATEKHFQAGWSLLRAGKSADAAIELGEAADASETDLANDARYFQGVALIRAGHGGQAERALVAFLDHAPRSTRRGRAAVMLGRLIAARGDQVAARSWFESALHDVDPSVVAAARAEIDAHR